MPRSRTRASNSPAAYGTAASTSTHSEASSAAIDARLAAERERVEFRVPFERGEVLARLHREAAILESRQDDGATLVTALVTPKVAGQVRKALAGGG